MVKGTKFKHWEGRAVERGWSTLSPGVDQRCGLLLVSWKGDCLSSQDVFHYEAHSPGLEHPPS